MTEKLSEYSTYFVLKSIKMSQENEMCQRIFAMGQCLVSPSKCPVVFLRVLTPSAFQSVSFPLNCLTATKNAPQEPPGTKNIQDQDQDLPGTAISFALSTAYKVIT